MANILALDTSSDACSVALNCGGEVAEIFKIIPRKHTHELLPMVEQILAQAALSVSQLDGIAFGRGPGSFAGIRIATGVSQGLAFAADLPLLPISTLAALAEHYYSEHPAYQGRLLCALDARMDEVYWGVYGPNAPGVVLLQQEAVARPADLALVEESALIGVGSGFNYREQLPPALASALQQVDVDVHPRAAAISRLGALDFAAAKGVAPAQAEPVYLRNQVTWKKKDQQ
ncbi:MAG: tRNA (adenosine(37)-N6)-threonylcarbamoyltransferase complex dimerization subunit type 1 TsaB [Pseudomonadales bacterium]